MASALFLLSLISLLLFLSQGFNVGRLSLSSRLPSALRAKKIAEGVEFDTIAREWRFKWNPEDDKRSLVSAQATLNIFSPSLKKIDGVKNVQRIVCGGCHDFKVIVALDSDKFGAWESKKFAPEEEFLASIKAIAGVTQVETQTYTIESI
mmetsp:Transcript_14734/g.15923  ORF Transcript_14734/g.15923 Transcript_14734/m.15923 type:complete len:150 (-) Transcript_14734:1291-1740(-)|eukprot:gene1478-1566_t